MSGAIYEWCPGCETKSLYVGEEDVPDGVEVWHQDCRIRATQQAVEAERERIRQITLAFAAAWDAHKAACAEHGWEVPGISAYRAGWNDLADLIGGDEQ